MSNSLEDSFAQLFGEDPQEEPGADQTEFLPKSPANPNESGTELETQFNFSVKEQVGALLDSVIQEATDVRESFDALEQAPAPHAENASSSAATLPPMAPADFPTEFQPRAPIPPEFIPDPSGGFSAVPPQPGRPPDPSGGYSALPPQPGMPPDPSGGFALPPQPGIPPDPSGGFALPPQPSIPPDPSGGYSALPPQPGMPPDPSGGFAALPPQPGIPPDLSGGFAPVDPSGGFVAAAPAPPAPPPPRTPSFVPEPANPPTEFNPLGHAATPEPADAPTDFLNSSGDLGAAFLADDLLGPNGATPAAPPPPQVPSQPSAPPPPRTPSYVPPHDSDPYRLKFSPPGAEPTPSSPALAPDMVPTVPPSPLESPSGMPAFNPPPGSQETVSQRRRGQVGDASTVLIDAEAAAIDHAVNKSMQPSGTGHPLPPENLSDEVRAASKILMGRPDANLAQPAPAPPPPDQLASGLQINPPSAAGSSGAMPAVSREASAYDAGPEGWMQGPDAPPAAPPPDPLGASENEVPLMSAADAIAAGQDLFHTGDGQSAGAPETGGLKLELDIEPQQLQRPSPRPQPRPPSRQQSELPTVGSSLTVTIIKVLGVLILLLVAYLVLR